MPADFTLRDYADCLAAVIDAVGLGPAHVGGLSWGGMVAQQLHHSHPEMVRTLLLIDPYAGWGGSLPEEERRVRVEGLRRALEAPPEEFDATFPGLFAAGPPARFASLLAEIAADVRPQTFRILLRMADLDLSDQLRRIHVPTLLVWGELDARSPLTVARQFQDAIPHAQLVVIPGAGQVSHLEQPKRFNEAVRAFCRAHSARAP